MKALRLLGVACACSLLLAASPPHTQIYGFTVVGSNREFALEDQFVDIPSAAGALESAAALAIAPHYAGSAGDYKLALYVRDRFKSFGFDTSMETLTARVDVPKRLVLELVPTGALPAKVPSYVPLANRRRERQRIAAQNGTAHAQGGVGLDLRELPDPADADTANPAVGLPFIAGSADGNVTAPLVYAGHGLPADYGLLAAHNVDPSGAILLIRYGAQSRGDLVRYAQNRGAVGVILYDDPADDGYSRGATSPNGPWRPLNSVQRGSVGAGVTIPVLPVSAANARLLLQALHGPSAPRPWAGGLSVNYPFARGPAAVHMLVEMEHRTTTLWNTIGVLHGTLPGQELVIGAQRDAWVYGIGAGGGGTVTLLETARGLGYLASNGWQPGRTIVFAAWDGEELGAYGSLAYIRRHGDEIRTDSVAYLNTEPSITGGTFGADAVAAIAPTIAEASQVVSDPAQPAGSIYDRWAYRTHGALPPIDRGMAGDDRPAFLFGAGTPTATATFTGPFGPYHSSYDTLQYARTISDPNFDLHRTAAQIYGVALMRLADADVVPYHFSAYVGPMRGALRALAALARARHVTMDVRDFSNAIARFAANAARSDRATRLVATANDAEREMAAARNVDLVTYGVEGETRVTFPDIADAIRSGNQSTIDLAVARVRTSLDQAGSLIAH